MADQSVLPKSDKRSLRVDLSASEIHTYSLQLANENRAVNSIEDEKKTVTSQYTARLNEKKASIKRLSAVVSDGFEMREIECEIQYNKPEVGKKTIIRKDLDKVHAVERMEEWEMQLELFGSQEDEDTSDLLEAEREKLRGNSNGKKGRGGRK
jgi:hypothetical protein